MNRPRTVYILGAGASAAVGLPIQNKLIEKIFTLSLDDLPASDDFVVDESLAMYYEYFEVSRRYLADFLVQYFANNDISTYYNQIKNDIPHTEQYKLFCYGGEYDSIWSNIYTSLKDIVIPLEDVFTTLDKVKLNNDSYGIFTNTNIENVSISLKNCIIFVLSFFVEKSENNSALYSRIAKYLTKVRYNTPDVTPFSIISLNWDTLIDSSIYRACSEHNAIHPNKQIFPDYCFYNYDLSNNLPSTLIKPFGFLNIKIMKLHGSINWLECPNCGRIYTDFKNLISLKSMVKKQNLNDEICSSCNTLNRSSFTQSIIVTPTFLKTFNSHYLKNIWHNAYLDLCKATEIVFLGYSLPDADFELKYILKKAIQKDCKITVVLHESDNPEYYSEYLNGKLSDEDSQFKSSILSKLSLPENRFRNFFTNNLIEFNYNGIDDYFKEK